MSAEILLVIILAAFGGVSEFYRRQTLSELERRRVFWWDHCRLWTSNAACFILGFMLCDWI